MRAALIVLLLIPAFVLLVGCANGVEMTDEERIACREHGCAAFTEGELRALSERAARWGYRKGWTDAMNQRSEGI